MPAKLVRNDEKLKVEADAASARIGEGECAEQNARSRPDGKVLGEERRKERVVEVRDEEGYRW